MRIHRSWVVLAAVFSAPSCAHLEVRVQVLDKAKLDAVAVLRTALDAAERKATAHLRSGEFDRVRGGIPEAVGRELASRPGLATPEDASKMVKSVTKFVDDAFAEARQRYEEAGLALWKAKAIPPEEIESRRDEYLTNLLAARDAYAAGDGALLSSVGAFRKDAENIKAAEPPPATQPADTEAVSTTRPFSEVMFGMADSVERLVAEGARSVAVDPSSLIHDAQAALVVSAPKDAWEALFTRVYGSGRFGNVDIAVIQERAEGGVPDYWLKGVRLDAENVTRAAFKGLKEVLRVAAAAAGIPLPAAGSGGGGGEGGGTTPSPAATRELQARSEAARIRQATVGLLDNVLTLGSVAVDPSAAITPDQRKKALDAIRQAITDFKNATAASQGE